MTPAVDAQDATVPGSGTDSVFPKGSGTDSIGVIFGSTDSVTRKGGWGETVITQS